MGSVGNRRPRPVPDVPRRTGKRATCADLRGRLPGGRRETPRPIEPTAYALYRPDATVNVRGTGKVITPSAPWPRPRDPRTPPGATAVPSCGLRNPGRGGTPVAPGGVLGSRGRGLPSSPESVLTSLPVRPEA